jgi:PmbA protein
MKSVEELVKEVKRGVLVTNVWYTRFSNYVSGEFSTVPRDAAFYVENGEIRYRISMGAKGSASAGIRINDSLPRMLKEMDATGGDTMQVYNWDSQDYNFTPALLVRDVKLTSATII